MTRPKRDPMNPVEMTSLKHWGDAPEVQNGQAMRANASADCGWGRLIFGQTFDDPKALADELQNEVKGQRDVALYMRDANVVLWQAPQQLFLDPSLTFRLALDGFQPPADAESPFAIRPAASAEDEEAMNRIYRSRGMVPVYPGFLASHLGDDAVSVLVVEDTATGHVVGAVTGVDHKAAFGDPDNAD